MLRPLGRIRDPQTPRAIELYPYAADPPMHVERLLPLPTWIATHNQGREGSCVGHSVALERAIANTLERRADGHPRARWLRFDPIALWRAAKAIDEYPQTRPEDDNGTSVRAAYEITRLHGLYRVKAMELVGNVPRPVGEVPEIDGAAGVDRYAWAVDVDAMRAAIAAGVAISIGVDWHVGFDTPLERKAGRSVEAWIPERQGWGSVRGGHSPALTGASDRRGAFRLSNSWGDTWGSHGHAWISYESMAALLHKEGEAALVTDRIGT